MFDEDKNGDVDFNELLQGLSLFSTKGEKEDKLRFAFKMYDMDNDGYISNGELYQVSKQALCMNFLCIFVIFRFLK